LSRVMRCAFLDCRAGVACKPRLISCHPRVSAWSCLLP